MFTRGFALLTALVVATIAHAASLETQSNPVPSGAIQIDGDFSDWLDIPHYQSDAVGDTTGAIDILYGAIAHDDDFIYVLWRNAGPTGITFDANWVWFDMDNDPDVGRKDMFGVTPPLARGVEWNLGGTYSLNLWTGPTGATGVDQAHIGKSVATGSTTGSGNPDFMEWSISRSAVYQDGRNFNPTNGTTFQFVYIGVSGNHDAYPADVATDWFTYDTAGTFNPGVPGDANGDGFVTIDDYLLIRANSFTNQIHGQNGDVNDDGIVDFADFHEWKEFFPGGAAAADAAIASLGIPEPAALCMSITGLAGVLLAVGRRSKR